MPNPRIPPVVPGLRPSAEYTVAVEGRDVFVHTQPGFAGGSIAFASFDFEGAVEVRVTSAWEVDSVAVHPLSRGVACRLEGRTAVFTLERPGPYFVKWNDAFELPVYIFANPPEADVPDPADPAVRWFGPGIHRPGPIRLESGQTLYLAAGAHVSGTLLARDAGNIRVAGRGILCGSHLPFGHMEPDITELAGFKRCRDISVEGVTLLDSFGWTLVFYDCDRVRVDNVKILNERLYSTDGINPVNCRDVRIAGCFARCKDDCVSIKGLNDPARQAIARTPIRDIEVRDCVFWSDNNNGVVLGSETWAESIDRIAFRGLDLLKTTNTCGDIAAALSVIALHDTGIADVTFEDIRIEHATGPVFNVIMPDVLFGNIHGWRGGGGARVRGVTFRRVSVTGGRPKRSHLRGRDPDRLVEKVRFEQCAWMGRPLAALADARVEANGFVRDVVATP